MRLGLRFAQSFSAFISMIIGIMMLGGIRLVEPQWGFRPKAAPSVRMGVATSCACTRIWEVGLWLSPQTRDGFTTQCHDRQLLRSWHMQVTAFAAPTLLLHLERNAHDAFYDTPLRKVSDSAGEVSIGINKLADSIALCRSQCSCVTPPIGKRHARR